jgi:adenosyl cobinamide kinase/adenosyl cobinamide phosphate guanylyltransferase
MTGADKKDGNIIFLRGCPQDVLTPLAVEMFEDQYHVDYLVTGEISTQAFKSIIYLECSRDCDWHIRRCFDILVDTVDADNCNYFILDSVSEYIYNVLSRETYPKGAEYYTDLIAGEMERLIDLIREKNGNIIIISNELMNSRNDKPRRLVSDVTYFVNQRIAHLADETYMIEDGEMIMKRYSDFYFPS